jgi:hypothetical protein
VWLVVSWCGDDGRLTLNLALVYTGSNEVGAKGYPDCSHSLAPFGRSL